MSVRIGGWIGIKDTVPPDDKDILLVVKDDDGKRQVEIGRILPFSKVYPSYTVKDREDKYVLASLNMSKSFWIYREVTHWMLIPDMPEEGTKE